MLEALGKYMCTWGLEINPVKIQRHDFNDVFMSPMVNSMPKLKTKFRTNHCILIPLL